MAHDPAIRELTLATTDGVTLEAQARLPSLETAGGPPVGGARVVLAHPHPLRGGNMSSLVISELFRILPLHGVAVLRFNFRGVDGSGGEHGYGRDEGADVTAAIDSITELAPEGPLVLCGWSFGADVSLSVTDARIDGWAAIAPPLAVLPLDELSAACGVDARPKVLLVPEHDQFRPPAAARESTATWTNTTIEVVSGADHFLAGRTEKVADLVAAFAASLP